MAPAPLETPIRALEIVHRDLNSPARYGRSAGTSLLGSEAALRSAGSPRSNGSTTEVPDVISHWAVRIEGEPGQGREDDPTTWVYFGLSKAKGRRCELSDEAFVSDDGPDRRFRGYTLWSPEDYATVTEARMLIAAADKRGYSLMNNNCQDFAVSFFLAICHQADSVDDMTELLSRNSFFWKLLTIKEEDDIVFENGGEMVARFKRVRARNGSVLLEYRLGQDAWVHVRSN